MKNKKPNLLVIGNIHCHPSAKAFLEKFVSIIKETSNNAYIISGDEPPNYKNVLWIKFKWNIKKKVMRKYIDFIKNQVKLIWIIIKTRADYDLAIILPTSFIFPTILLRLLAKKNAIFVAQKPNHLIIEFLCRLNFIFANLLIVESENVIKNWGIEKYMWKVALGSIYVNTIFFKKIREIQERKQIVGYVGSLEKRKGIEELIYAISAINGTLKTQIRFVIGGKGQLVLHNKIF